MESQAKGAAGIKFQGSFILLEELRIETHFHERKRHLVARGVAALYFGLDVVGV